MSSFKYRFQMYRELENKKPLILDEAEKASREIGIPDKLKGQIGLTGAVSGCHGLLLREVAEAMHESAQRIIPAKVLDYVPYD